MLANASPQYLSYLIFRRRKVFIAAFTVIMALYGLLVLTQHAQYESVASIMVKVVDQEVAMPDLMSQQEARGAMSSANLAEKLINAEQLVITSEDVLEAALHKVDVRRVYAEIEARAQKLQTPALTLGAELLVKDISVNVNANTNVLRVSLFNTDAKIAQATLEALIEATVERQAALTRDPRLKFLEAKLGTLQHDADLAQQAVLEFHKKTQITSFDEERSLLLKQRDSTQQSLSELEADRVAAEGRSKTLARALTHTPSKVELSDENDRVQRQIDEAQTRLTTAQGRYEVAKQRFAEGNPELIDQAAQLQSARDSLAQLSAQPMARLRFGASPLHQKLSEDLSSARTDAEARRASIAERQQQLAQINERLSYLDSQELVMRDLQHRREIVDQDYRSYLQRVQNARILADMNGAGISSLSVLQPPTLPYETARPRKLLLFALALVVSLIVGFAVSMLLESYDSTISRADDVEAATGLPLLGVVDLQKSR